MPLHLTSPIAPDLAAAYRSQGLWRTTPLRAGLEQVAEDEPERIAVIDNEGTWTYGQLREQVEASIGALAAAGVGPDAPVVIVAPNSRPAVAAVLGTVRANGVAIVIDRRCGPLDLANAIASSGARHVVVPAGLRDELRLAEHDVRALDLHELGSARPESDWPEPDPSLARLVIFTSGTTRRSKGVVHSLDTMLRGVDNLAWALEFSDLDCSFLSSPVGTMTGLDQVFLALEGGTLLLEDRFDPARSLGAIERHGATVIGGAPVILEMLFDEYERQGIGSTSLRRVALGGTMIPRSVLEVAIERFGIVPSRAYGSSEAPMHTSSHQHDTLEERLTDDGVLMPGSECRLGDEYDNGAELWVRGPNLFQGYLYEEDNEGVFEDGWFRTGDLVELTGTGRLRILGRLKDVVARKGLKIALPEVDDAATSIGGVIEVAAYSVPDDESGERVALAVRTDAPASITYEVVVAAMAGHGLARGKLPEEIVVWTDPLPRNPSGKIVRAELAAQAGAKLRHLAPRLRPSTEPCGG